MFKGKQLEWFLSYTTVVKLVEIFDWRLGRKNLPEDLIPIDFRRAATNTCATVYGIRGMGRREA
jgi:hypothetical protein